VLNTNRKKMLWTVIIVVVLGLTLVPTTRKFLFESHLFSFVDSKATQYVDEGLVRAGTAFAVARSFNAIVSVFQESQLQLEPGGVGVSLALGAALDPANDLVERFSWVMLASLTSLGVQKVLIEITPFVSIQIFLLLGLLSLLVGLWLPTKFRPDLMQIGWVLLFSTLLIRLAVPCMAYLNHQVYTTFLETRHDQSVEALGQTVSELESHELNGLAQELNTTQVDSADKEKSGWLSRTMDNFDKVVTQGKSLLDIKAKLEAVKTIAREMIDKIVDLIVVFVLSAIVLPLLFLWGFFKLGKFVVGQGGQLLVRRVSDDWRD